MSAENPLRGVDVVTSSGRYPAEPTPGTGEITLISDQPGRVWLCCCAGGPTAAGDRLGELATLAIHTWLTGAAVGAVGAVAV
jgi:hypothetical protein